MSADEGLVRIGRVVKPHGIRGELVVAAEGGTLDGLPPGSAIVVAGASYTITRSRPHQGRVLLVLEECADRTAAEKFRGAAVQVVDGTLPGLDGDEWYADDLAGWALLDGAGVSLGTVTAVMAGPVHDYLQVGADEPRLVPMVREWLVDADPARRTITMKLPDGLMNQGAG